MNLTLFRIEPFPGEARRILYVLAPSVKDALELSRFELPHPKCITAIANNAYQGEDFPRFIEWEPRPQPAEISFDGVEYVEPTPGCPGSGGWTAKPPR